MTQDNNSKCWFRIDILLKEIRDPSSYITIKFINSTSEAQGTNYLPLADSFSGIGQAVGQDGMPYFSSGTITINDDWESLGKERRVLDYFNKYTCQEQVVDLYYAFSSIDNTEIPIDWVLRWSGKAVSWSYVDRSLDIQVTTNSIPDVYINKIITEDLAPSGFQVPSQSIGKPLPVILDWQNEAIDNPSPVVVPAYSIKWTEDPEEVLDATNSRGLYAYATNFGGYFKHSISKITNGKKILIEDDEGIYRFADSISQISSANSDGYTPVSYGLVEMLIPVQLTAGTDFCCTGLGWRCRGQGAPVTPVGKIKLTLYRSLADSITTDMTAWEQVRTIEVEKSDYYSSIAGASDTHFAVSKGIEKPFVMGGSGFGNAYSKSPYQYAVGVVLSNYTGSSTTDFTSADSDILLDTYFYRTSDSGGWATTTGALPIVYIYGLQYAAVEASSDSNGHQYAGIDFYSPFVTNLLEMNVAVTNVGVVDIFGGVATAGDFMTRPDHALEAITYEYITSWQSSPNFDFAEFASLYTDLFDSYTVIPSQKPYSRKIIGATQNENLSSIIASLVKDSSSALIVLPNGKLALKPWGGTSAVTKVFTDDDILEVKDITVSDASSVVNDITISWGKSFTNVFDQWESTGVPENYTGVLRVNKSTATFYDLLYNSFALYGKRELSESASIFLGDQESALVRAKFIASTSNHAPMTCTIIVPFRGNEDLQLLSVVDILSAFSPSFYGSTISPKKVHYAGREIDIAEGEYMPRAQRYRCQIMAIRDSWNQQVPTVELLLRVIHPRHDNDITADRID